MKELFNQLLKDLPYICNAGIRDSKTFDFRIGCNNPDKNPSKFIRIISYIVDEDGPIHVIDMDRIDWTKPRKEQIVQLPLIKFREGEDLTDIIYQIQSMVEKFLD